MVICFFNDLVDRWPSGSDKKFRGIPEGKNPVCLSIVLIEP